MLTYPAPSDRSNLNQPTESQVWLHELQRIQLTVIHQGEKRFRQWQPSITRQSFADSALNLAYY
jgi:hypothetical protein